MLFQQQNFEEAADAFERAERTEEANIARAYHLKQAAEDLPPSTKWKQRRAEFTKAARALVGSAVGVHVEDEKRLILRHAAECYTSVSMFEDAAWTYCDAKLWNDAAICFFDAKKLKEAVAIVQTQELRPSVRDRILASARYTYLRGMKLKYGQIYF